MEKKYICHAGLKKSAKKATRKHRGASVSVLLLFLCSGIVFSGVGLAFSQNFGNGIPFGILAALLSFPFCAPIFFGVLESFCDLAKGKRPSLGTALSWLDDRLRFCAALKFFAHLAARLFLIWIGFFAVLSAICILLLKTGSFFVYFGPSAFEQTLLLMNVFAALAIISALGALWVSLRWFVAVFLIVEKPDLKTSQAFVSSARIMKGYTFEAGAFLLGFSGWLALSVLTLGVGLIVAAPRIAVSSAYFAWLRRDLFEIIKRVEPAQSRGTCAGEMSDTRPTLA